MPLPDGVAVKLDLYTLACRELLSRLDDLRLATLADLRFDYEACLECFDEVLHNFFERSSAKDRHLAAEQFGNLLGAQASLFRDSNEKAAAVFDDVVEAIHDRISSWHYQADLEEFHHQGRELACRFFADSPWPETQERLSRECHLIIRYGGPAEDDRIAARAESFGYHAAPMAYYPSYWDEEQKQDRTDVLLVRFTFHNNFALYLAYPFLFCHEYTAHVYATDHDNELFSDGWMLWAAYLFLKQEWNKAPDQFELSSEQVNIFHKRLYHKLNRNPHRGCTFARRFVDLLPGERLDQFWQITHELAAFQPKPGEKAYLPTQLINALEHEYTIAPERLLDKVQASSDIRELMTILSPV